MRVKTLIATDKSSVAASDYEVIASVARDSNFVKSEMAEIGGGTDGIWCRKYLGAERPDL